MVVLGQAHLNSTSVKNLPSKTSFARRSIISRNSVSRTVVSQGSQLQDSLLPAVTTNEQGNQGSIKVNLAPETPHKSNAAHVTTDPIVQNTDQTLRYKNSQGIQTPLMNSNHHVKLDLAHYADAP